MNIDEDVSDIEDDDDYLEYEDELGGGGFEKFEKPEGKGNFGFVKEKKRVKPRQEYIPDDPY